MTSSTELAALRGKLHEPLPPKPGTDASASERLNYAAALEARDSQRAKAPGPSAALGKLYEEQAEAANAQQRAIHNRSALAAGGRVLIEAIKDGRTTEIALLPTSVESVRACSADAPGFCWIRTVSGVEHRVRGAAHEITERFAAGGVTANQELSKIKDPMERMRRLHEQNGNRK